MMHMPSKPRQNDVPNGLHYNLKYKTGVLCNRVPPRYFQGEKPDAIEWVWIIELKRYATSAEIAALCTRN